MKTVYRYNSRNRSDRNFNNTGMEKNPNRVAFYATNLEYASNYQFVYTEDGDIDYECELEVKEVSVSNLFDMNADYATLDTYKAYINSQIGLQLRDYTRFMNEAKKASDRKMWASQIEGLKNRENELVATLISNEFQTLSDYDLQNTLISELTEKGFNGYFTRNEIAIF